MEALARLKARIASLAELRDLVRALRALAAARLQEAEASLDGIRHHVAVVERAIGQAARLLPEPANGIPARAGPQAEIVIAVCSEHGFVGALNEHLLERARARAGARHALVIIGRRGALLAEEKGLDVADTYPMATHAGGVLAITRRLAAHLANASMAEIVFGTHGEAGAWQPRVKRILPLDPALLAHAGQGNPPLHQLAPDVLLERLAREYLLAEITHAMMESLASENAARLRAMAAADHNIADKLTELRRRENVLRQEAITAELLDVVTGAEAIMAPRTGQ